MEEKEKVNGNIKALHARLHECKQRCAQAYRAYKEILKIEEQNAKDAKSEKGFVFQESPLPVDNHPVDAQNNDDKTVIKPEPCKEVPEQPNKGTNTRQCGPPRDGEVPDMFKKLMTQNVFLEDVGQLEANGEAAMNRQATTPSSQSSYFLFQQQPQNFWKPQSIPGLDIKTGLIREDCFSGLDSNSGLLKRIPSPQAVPMQRQADYDCRGDDSSVVHGSVNKSVTVSPIERYQRNEEYQGMHYINAQQQSAIRSRP